MKVKEISIIKLILAIQQQEGWNKKNSLSRRNNNPGNLKMGKMARRFGAVTMDKHHHAIFPTEHDGRGALVTLLLEKFWNMELLEVGKIYAEDTNWGASVEKIIKSQD